MAGGYNDPMQTWTWTWAFRNFLAELVMPPGLFIVLALLALILLRHRQKLQKAVVIGSLIMIWVVSTPLFSNYLIAVTDPWMAWPSPLLIADGRVHLHQSKASRQQMPQAIVVLGGGRRKGALESPEYGRQDLSKNSLERVRFAAKLASYTDLPILVTGGMPDQTSAKDQPEAKIMAQVLKEEFHQPVQWVEDQSATTQENAVFSAKLLKAQGITHIYLVTHFWHMPRAQKIFERQGLQVIPAPHGYEGSQEINPLDFYPSRMTKTRQIWHELLGMAWYKMRYE